MAKPTRTKKASKATTAVVTGVAALLTAAVLEAATKEARTHGPVGTKTGDTCLSGRTRAKVVSKAVHALDAAGRKELESLSNEDTHRFVAGVLKHAGCLLDSVDGAVNATKELVGDTDGAAPCMVSPKRIRGWIAKLNKAGDAPAPAPEPTTAPVEPEPEGDDVDLASLTKKELLAIAKERQIEGLTSKTTKAKILEALA